MSRILLLCTVMMFVGIGCSHVHFYWEPHDPTYEDYEEPCEYCEEEGPYIPACRPGAYGGRSW